MVILITGASGGLGSVLGKTLVDKGLTVYGTRRDADSGGTHPFTMLSMEVTEPSSVQRCIDEVVRREGRIDVLVNCINQMIIGSVDEQTPTEFRSVFETNVLGLLQVCQAVLPVMRSQGEGLIVNMSSAGGFVAVPYMSAYVSAKFAVEAFSESLYHEVRPHGIDVVIMQPVAMNINRPGTGSHLRMVDGVRPESVSNRILDRMNQDTAASKLTPQAVAERVYKVISSDKRPLRVPMDRAVALSLVKRLAPQPVINRLVDHFVG